MASLFIGQLLQQVGSLRDLGLLSKAVSRASDQPQAAERYVIFLSYSSFVLLGVHTPLLSEL